MTYSLIETLTYDPACMTCNPLFTRVLE